MKSLIAIIAMIGGGLASFFSGRRAGRDSEKAKQAEKDLKQAEEVDEIQEDMLDAAADRPRDRDELRKRMRDDRF